MLDGIYKKLRSKVIFPILVLVIILPGVYWSVRLHPLQYVYYNGFAGYVQGAGDDYELDYWNVGYKLAMDYIVEHVPEHSKIIVWKDNWLGAAYSGGKRYKFEGHPNVLPEDYINYDYAILPNGRYSMPFKEYSVIYSIEFEHHDLIDIIKIQHPE